MIFLKRFAKRLAPLLAMALLAVALLAACGKQPLDAGPYIPATSDAAAGNGLTIDDASSAPDDSTPAEEESTEPEASGEATLPQSSAAPTRSGTTAAARSSTTAVVRSSAKTTAAAKSPVIEYVQQVQEIFNSKDFTIKGSGVLNGAATALTLAVSGDKTAVSLPTSAVLRLAPDEMVKGSKAAMEQLLGKDSRLVLSPDRALWVLPGLGRYMDLGDLGDLPLDGVADIMAWLGSGDALKNIKASTAQVNGKENLVATLAGKDGKDIAKLYFLEGQLQCIEPLGDAAKLISRIDVTSLKNSADASYFNTKNLLPLNLSDLQALGGLDSLPTLPAFW